MTQRVEAENTTVPRTFSLKMLLVLTAFVAVMVGSLPFLPKFPRLGSIYPKAVLLVCWWGATLGASIALTIRRNFVSDRYWYALLAASSMGTWITFIQHYYWCVQEAKLSTQFPGVGAAGFVMFVALYSSFLAFSVAWIIPARQLQPKSAPKPAPKYKETPISSFVTLVSRDRLSLVDRFLLGIALLYLCVCLCMSVYEPCVTKLENLPSPITFLLGLPWSPLIYQSFLFCPIKYRFLLLLFVYAVPPIINVHYLLRTRGIQFRIAMAKSPLTINPNSEDLPRVK